MKINDMDYFYYADELVDDSDAEHICDELERDMRRFDRGFYDEGQEKLI